MDHSIEEANYPQDEEEEISTEQLIMILGQVPDPEDQITGIYFDALMIERNNGHDVSNEDKRELMELAILEYKKLLADYKGNTFFLHNEGQMHQICIGCQQAIGADGEFVLVRALNGNDLEYAIREDGSVQVSLTKEAAIRSLRYRFPKAVMHMLVDHGQFGGAVITCTSFNQKSLARGLGKLDADGAILEDVFVDPDTVMGFLEEENMQMIVCRGNIIRVSEN